jgi:putative oxidoreductase
MWEMNVATIQPLSTPASTASTRDVLPFVARAGMAAIFLISGTGKLLAPEATIAYIASAGLPYPSLGLLIALIVELGCATALIIG